MVYSASCTAACRVPSSRYGAVDEPDGWPCCTLWLAICRAGQRTVGRKQQWVGYAMMSVMDWGCARGAEGSAEWVADGAWWVGDGADWVEGAAERVQDSAQRVVGSRAWAYIAAAKFSKSHASTDPISWGLAACTPGCFCKQLATLTARKPQDCSTSSWRNHASLIEPRLDRAIMHSA